jgi:hypothetical protein
MSAEVIQSVAYDNYDDFQLVHFLFSLNFNFKYFEDYLMTETELRVRFIWTRSESG